MNRRRSNFYRRVRDQANQLLQKYIRSRRIPKASGACVDCGASRYVCYDHRDYSEALTVDVVCYSCNELRGAGWIPFLNIESLLWIRYREAA